MTVWPCGRAGRLAGLVVLLPGREVAFREVGQVATQSSLNFALICQRPGTPRREGRGPDATLAPGDWAA
ncbi:MAG: hypothetical protein ABSH46_17470 [Bryobacteraceae bacterium]|jgi:hypothetical protein